jgi:methyl-accepting chemotaxis protein
MQGRFTSIIWRLMGAQSVLLALVLGLAYGAGAHSGGLGLRDFASLPGTSGLELLAAIFLALSVLASLLWLGNRIVKPLKELADVSSRLAAGEYALRAHVEAEDDFACLADNLNHTAEVLERAVTEQARLQRHVTEYLTIATQIGRGDLTLRGFVGDNAMGNVVQCVNGLLESLEDCLDRTRRAASNITSAGKEIAANADRMLAMATQEEQELTDAGAALDQVAVAVRQIAAQSESTAEASRRVLESGEQGARAVSAAMEAMEHTRSSAVAGVVRLSSLADRSREIGDTFSLIGEIIERSNLLAHSAAMEAARAGESGRVFAVLSEEVRSLAEHSRKVNTDIAALVRGIRAETADTIAAMESGVQEAEAGMRLGEQVGGSLKAIEETTRQVAEAAQQVLQASRLQAREAESAAQALRMISGFIRQNSQEARQAGRVAEQVALAATQANDALGQFRTASSGAARPQLASAAVQR